MQRRLGTDVGLTARMFLTMFLLAAVYLLFMGVLWALHVPLLLLIPVAILLLGAQYYFSDKLILLSLGAREVSEPEAPQLHEIVNRLAQMTGIPKPKVAIIDSPVPNALATGRDPNHAMVAVTTGILDQLDDQEMQAVLAHELSHVIHRDIAVMAMASFFATIASFIVIFLVSAAVWAISFLLIRTLSRYREYAADRGSAIITRDPSRLASALLKISGRMQRIPDTDLRQMQAGSALMFFPAISRGSLGEIFATHPSLEHRIARLQAMEAQLSR